MPDYPWAMPLQNERPLGNAFAEYPVFSCKEPAGDFLQRRALSGYAIIPRFKGNALEKDSRLSQNKWKSSVRVIGDDRTCDYYPNMGEPV